MCGKAAAVAVFTSCLSAFSQTNRVTEATVHTAPSNEFLLAHLARQYSNDMRTVQGRVKWHGKPVAQTIDTNRLCKIERYADGTTHVEPFRTSTESYAMRTNSASWKSAAGKRKAALAARRAQIAARKSVAPGLKEARLATFDARHSESNVTINVNIGGN